MVALAQQFDRLSPDSLSCSNLKRPIHVTSAHELYQSLERQWTRINAVGAMTSDVEILIIGAGPAGLAAGTCCRDGQRQFVLVESGAQVEQRDHLYAPRLSEGVGGSGLYSDGKFSFFPSATALWRLPDRAAVTGAYSWLKKLLPDFGVIPPPFPQRMDQDGTTSAVAPNGVLVSKEYPSWYMSLRERERLARALEANCGSSLIPNTSVVRVEYDKRTNSFTSYLVTNDSTERARVSSKVVIFAGGRFGPMQLFTLIPELPKVFRRLEVGVRIQQPAGSFVLQDHPQLDPKLIFRVDSQSEYRTFCCCRDGEVVTITTANLKTVSGRGDCEVSGLSNIGFNLRIADERLASTMWPPLVESLTSASKQLPIVEQWDGFLEDPDGSRVRSSSSIARLFGNQISSRLARGLSMYKSAFPMDSTTVELIAPAIEAVAFYPSIDRDLRVSPYPLWVAGDSTGTFRGLTAAFVSGYYVATQAIKYLDSKR